MPEKGRRDAGESTMPQSQRSQRSPLVAAALVLAGLACWAGPTMVVGAANIGIRISHDKGEATGAPELDRRMAEDSRFLIGKAAEKRGVISVHPSHYGSAAQGCWELAVKNWAGEMHSPACSSSPAATPHWGAVRTPRMHRLPVPMHV
jgi:hypothetical protein